MATAPVGGHRTKPPHRQFGRSVEFLSYLPPTHSTNIRIAEAVPSMVGSLVE
jgi:hypothetical protein